MMVKQEVLDQEKYIEEIRKENEKDFLLTGKRKKYYSTTFGCPNVHQRGIKKA